MSNTGTSDLRMPFNTLSGCSRVVVPRISVVSVCSLPDPTRAEVSPTPLVFGVPQLPTPNVAPACIDIKPVFSAKFIPLRKDHDNASKGSSPPFRTASGFSDCLEGRYVLSVGLTLPCPVDALDGTVSGRVSFVSRTEKAEGLLFFSHRDNGKACELERVSFRLNIPRGCDKVSLLVTKPLSLVTVGRDGKWSFKLSVSRSDSSLCQFKLKPRLRLFTAALHSCPKISQYPYDKPTVKLCSKDEKNPGLSVFFTRPKDINSCDLQYKLSIRVPCAVKELDGTIPAKVTAVNNTSKASGFLIFSHADNGKACEINKLKVELKLPKGCDLVHIGGTTPQVGTAPVGKRASFLLRVSQGEKDKKCSFKLTPSLRLFTAALNRCLNITPVEHSPGVKLLPAGEDPPPDADELIDFQFTTPGNREGCDLQFKYKLQIPCVKLESDDFELEANGFGWKINSRCEGKETTEVTCIKSLSMDSGGLNAEMQILRYSCGVLVDVRSGGTRRIFGVAQCG